MMLPIFFVSHTQLNLQFIKDQDSIDIAGHKVYKFISFNQQGTAYHTPGHTKGSMCYHVGNFLFTGDTLLCNDVGPTNYEESKYHVDSLYYLQFGGFESIHYTENFPFTQ